MNIGIASHFNPYEVREYLDNSSPIPCINPMTSSVNAIVRGLLQEGHHVTVFTSYPKKGDISHLKGKNIDIYLIPSSPIIRPLKIFERIYMIGRLKKTIKLHINEIDVLHAHWTYEFAMAASYFSKIKPTFCTVRDWCPYIFSLMKGLKGRLYWYISLQIFKKVMNDDSIKLVANSNYTYNQIINNYPNKKIVLIPNPIMKEYILNSKIKHPKSKTFISIAQALDEKRKNIRTLLQAFSIYKKRDPNSKLILVGTYSKKMKQIWAKDNLLNGVILTGILNREELYTEIDSSSVLIHPSEEETFGNILLEGMARCLPCIGGNASGAVPMVLGYGKYGILCDIHTPNSLFEAMCKTEDEKAMNLLVSNASHYLKNNYQNDIIAQQHIDLYNSYLNL